MEKITFLIPVYNEEKTISEAIKIVLRLTKIKNKEIIIIDNGSTDKSQAIIKKFKNKSLKIIMRKKNHGYGATIKQALKIAKGKYMYIHFSDNEYDINPVFKMIRLAKKYDLAENVRNLIIENKLLFVNFFINNNNDDSEINLIHLTTTLPNDIIIFLKKYLKLLDHNETVNNDIINFMYNK